MPVKTALKHPHILRSRISFDIVHSPTIWRPLFARNLANDVSLANKRLAIFPNRSELRTAEHRALARLPTISILRGIFLGAFLSSPVLFTPGFAFLKKISNSSSPFLNPDRNPILRALVKPLMYDQFCAGRNRPEIQATVSHIKSLGFSGVILCYGKEIQIQKSIQPQVNDFHHSQSVLDEELQLWMNGNLETLNMVGEGDWIGIKYGDPTLHERAILISIIRYTGAGKCITYHLLQGNAAPKAFVKAMDAILQKASAQNCRIWIDAEQQFLQGSIDRWTIDLMRKYNRCYITRSKPTSERQEKNSSTNCCSLKEKAGHSQSSLFAEPTSRMTYGNAYMTPKHRRTRPTTASCGTF